MVVGCREATDCKAAVGARASDALGIARAHGLNANQVFGGGVLAERGELVDSAHHPQLCFPSRLPLRGSESSPPLLTTEDVRFYPYPSFQVGRRSGVEIGADAKLLRSILESLRK